MWPKSKPQRSKKMQVMRTVIITLVIILNVQTTALQEHFLRNLSELTTSSYSGDPSTVNIIDDHSPHLNTTTPGKSSMSGSNDTDWLTTTKSPSTGDDLLPTTATTQNQTTQVDETTLWQYTYYVTIFVYVPPFLIVLATVGNTLSIVILQHPMFRKSSTSFILSALALDDAMLVNTGLMRHWIRHLFGVDVRLFSVFGCRVHIFLTYFFGQVSSWAIVLMTAERFVSVWLPFKCKELCSRRRITWAWFGICVTLIGVNLHFFFTFALMYDTPGDPTTLACTQYPQFTDFWVYDWYWIDATVHSFIPFALIFFGNVFIVSRIIVANRLRKGQMQAAGAKNDKDNARKVASSTITLIVVSVIFLVLNIPSDTYFLLYQSGVISSNTPEDDALNQLIFAIITSLYYLNSSINFLMYFSSGHKFRQAAKDTITFRWCRHGTLTRTIGSSSVMTRHSHQGHGSNRLATSNTKIENLSMTSVSHGSSNVGMVHNCSPSTLTK